MKRAELKSGLLLPLAHRFRHAKIFDSERIPCDFSDGYLDSLLHYCSLAMHARKIIGKIYI